MKKYSENVDIFGAATITVTSQYKNICSAIAASLRDTVTQKEGMRSSIELMVMIEKALMKKPVKKSKKK